MGFETEKDYSRIIDPTGKHKRALAYLPYEKQQKDWAKERKDAISAAKLLSATGKFVGKINKSALESKYLDAVTDTGAKMFKVTDSKNMFDRVGRNLFGGSPLNYELTDKAIAEHYAFAPEGIDYKAGTGFTVPGESVKGSIFGIGKGKPGETYSLSDVGKGNVTQTVQKFSPQHLADLKKAGYGKMGLEKAPGAERFIPGQLKTGAPGIAGRMIGGGLGVLQMGSGIKTMMDPRTSAVQKVGGGVNTALGANAALAAVYGTQFWNPLGWAALAASAGATAAQVYG